MAEMSKEDLQVEQLQKGQFKVENKLVDPITIKRNNQAVVMYTTKETSSAKQELPLVNLNISPEAKSLKDFLAEIKFDGKLSCIEKESFKKAIFQNLDIFHLIYRDITEPMDQYSLHSNLQLKRDQLHIRLGLQTMAQFRNHSSTANARS